MLVLEIIGALILLLIIITVLRNLPGLRRYMRIRRM